MTGRWWDGAPGPPALGGATSGLRQGSARKSTRKLESRGSQKSGGSWGAADRGSRWRDWLDETPELGSSGPCGSPRRPAPDVANWSCRSAPRRGRALIVSAACHGSSGRSGPRRPRATNRAIGPVPAPQHALALDSAPSDALAVVARSLSAGGLKPSTLENRLPRIAMFASFLGAHGVATLDAVPSGVVADFVNSRRSSGAIPTDSERERRLSSVRLAYREARQLGLASGDPTVDVALSERRHVSARPLRDDEIELGRAHTLQPGVSRRAVSWALSEATARTSEMPHVRASHVDLDGGTVCLPGGPGIDPRIGWLTGWGIVQIRRRLAQLVQEDGPDPVLMGDLDWTDPGVGRERATHALVGVLRSARLRAPGVNPRSIPAWAGARALAGGATIDAVARLLGLRGLDQAAAIVGFDWRSQG